MRSFDHAGPIEGRTVAIVDPRPDGTYDAKVVDEAGHILLTLEGYRTSALGDVDQALKAPLAQAMT